MIKFAETELSADSRNASRTHMYVAATLYSGNLSQPVRVRNMSPTGALIEGDDLPSVGSTGELRRGSLRAYGEIAWQSGRKAGIAFHNQVDVRDWMSSLGVPKQAQIDAMVAEIKASKRSGQTLEPSFGTAENADNFAAQLRRLKADLATLATSIGSDVKMGGAHIRTLDRSIQRIDYLISTLQPSAIEAARGLL